MLSETTPSPSKRDEGSPFPLVQCVIRMKIWEKKKKKENKRLVQRLAPPETVMVTCQRGQWEQQRSPADVMSGTAWMSSEASVVEVP